MEIKLTETDRNDERICLCVFADYIGENEVSLTISKTFEHEGDLWEETKIDLKEGEAVLIPINLSIGLDFESLKKEKIH